MSSPWDIMVPPSGPLVPTLVAGAVVATAISVAGAVVATAISEAGATPETSVAVRQVGNVKRIRDKIENHVCHSCGCPITSGLFPTTEIGQSERVAIFKMLLPMIIEGRMSHNCGITNEVFKHIHHHLGYYGRADELDQYITVDFVEQLYRYAVTGSFNMTCQAAACCLLFLDKRWIPYLSNDHHQLIPVLGKLIQRNVFRYVIIWFLSRLCKNNIANAQVVLHMIPDFWKFGVPKEGLRGKTRIPALAMAVLNIYICAIEYAQQCHMEVDFIDNLRGMTPERIAQMVSSCDPPDTLRLRELGDTLMESLSKM